MSRSMKEYWMRRYDTEERSGHELTRLNKEQPVYAENLKEAQAEAERLNGCVDEIIVWSKNDTPTRYWSCAHRYSHFKTLEIDLFPSEKAMEKVAKRGQDMTKPPVIHANFEPRSKLDGIRADIAQFEKVLPIYEAEGKHQFAVNVRQTLAILRQELHDLQPEPQAEQLTLF